MAYTVNGTPFTAVVHLSMIQLPDEPMRPRLLDPRMGYFSDRKVLYSTEKDQSEKIAYVNRWRLEPKPEELERYKKGELVEPAKPIVFYVDNALPAKWKKYIKLGIEDWQPAFEAIGFKNAIVARDFPTDDPDFDPDDIRYSCFRYATTTVANAMGPSWTDPRSGEIIQASVYMYHDVLKLLHNWKFVQTAQVDPKARAAVFDEETMGASLRYVASHEIGHTLGLMHNMRASYSIPVDSLRSPAFTAKYGTTTSIMDYARNNYVAQPEDRISEKGLFPRIGDYDKWAIKWGYQYRPEFKDPFKEKAALRAEVTKKLKGDHRLLFIGDEGKGSDPRSQSEDLGDNNMKANEYGIKNLKRVMENILTWTAQPDGQYDDLNTIYNSVRVQYLKYTLQVQKNLGGRYTKNVPDSKGRDYVPRSIQKEVVEWLGRNLFVAPLWLYPDEVVSRVGLKAVDEISDRQSSALALLLARECFTISIQLPSAYPNRIHWTSI